MSSKQLSPKQVAAIWAAKKPLFIFKNQAFCPGIYRTVFFKLVESGHLRFSEVDGKKCIVATEMGLKSLVHGHENGN